MSEPSQQHKTNTRSPQWRLFLLGTINVNYASLKRIENPKPIWKCSFHNAVVTSVSSLRCSRCPLPRHDQVKQGFFLCVSTANTSLLNPFLQLWFNSVTIRKKHFNRTLCAAAAYFVWKFPVSDESHVYPNVSVTQCAFSRAWKQIIWLSVLSVWDKTCCQSQQTVFL